MVKGIANIIEFILLYSKGNVVPNKPLGTPLGLRPGSRWPSRFLSLLKLEDNITLKNCLFVHDFLNNNLPVSFENYFVLQSELNSLETRQSSRGSLFIPSINCVKYGQNAVKYQSILAWNQMIQIFPNHDLSILSKTVLKKMIKNHFIQSYGLHQT